MNSRERILAAIAHQTIDRIPVDLGATPSSGISAIAYSNLVQYLGKGDLPVHIYDVVQQLAQPDWPILNWAGVDVIDIGRAFNEKPSDWYPVRMSNGAEALYPQWFHPSQQPDGSWVTYDDDGQRILSKMPVGATFFDQTYFAYLDGYPDSYEGLDAEMHRVMWSRHVHSPWDHAGETDFFSQLRERALHLRQTTDKALMIVCGCNLFEWGTFLRRMDNFLMDLMCDPDNVARLLDELLKRHLATLEKVCASVGDIADIIRFGDDLGMFSGPFMDPDTYRNLFKPRHKILCDYVKTHSKMHTFIHSCGSISALMPDMIDAGIEIFNPVQTNAYNMSPGFLKKEFGASCTFWGGGIDNVGVLNVGSRQQIRDQVFERMETFSEGGGFVFATVHNILPDVPPENIMTLFEAVLEFNNRTSENEKTKQYEYAQTEPNIVNEPVVGYGALHFDVSKRYTYADYLTWLDDKRRELIDGFIHLMSAPIRRHARVTSVIYTRFFNFIENNKGKCRAYCAPFDVRLPLQGLMDDDKVYNVVQPDICVICDRSKLDDKGCIGAPDLIVEVTSPSTMKKDWFYKLNLYEIAGVREYWIVNPKEQVINVFILQPDGRYDDGTVYESHQKAPVLIFKGFEIDLNDVFED